MGQGHDDQRHLPVQGCDRHMPPSFGRSVCVSHISLDSLTQIFNHAEGKYPTLSSGLLNVADRAAMRSYQQIFPIFFWLRGAGVTLA